MWETLQANTADISSERSAVQHTASQHSMSYEVPTKYRRLVAKRAGQSFREVATVEEVDYAPPGAGEVTISGEEAICRVLCARYRQV